MYRVPDDTIEIFYDFFFTKLFKNTTPSVATSPNFFFHFFFVYGGEKKECIALKFYGFTMNTRVLLTGDTRAGEFSKVLLRVDTVEHYNNNCKKKNYHLTVQ